MLYKEGEMQRKGEQCRILKLGIHTHTHTHTLEKREMQTDLKRDTGKEPKWEKS